MPSLQAGIARNHEKTAACDVDWKPRSVDVRFTGVSRDVEVVHIDPATSRQCSGTLGASLGVLGVVSQGSSAGRTIIRPHSFVSYDRSSAAFQACSLPCPLPVEKAEQERGEGLGVRRRSGRRLHFNPDRPLAVHSLIVTLQTSTSQVSLLRRTL